MSKPTIYPNELSVDMNRRGMRIVEEALLCYIESIGDGTGELEGETPPTTEAIELRDMLRQWQGKQPSIAELSALLTAATKGKDENE